MANFNGSTRVIRREYMVPQVVISTIDRVSPRVRSQLYFESKDRESVTFMSNNVKVLRRKLRFLRDLLFPQSNVNFQLRGHYDGPRQAFRRYR